MPRRLILPRVVLGSMTSIYLGKTCVYFLELLLLRCNEEAVFFFKITQNQVERPFFLKKRPWINYIATNLDAATLQTEKKHIKLFSSPKQLVCENPGFPGR